VTVCPDNWTKNGHSGLPLTPTMTIPVERKALLANQQSIGLAQHMVCFQGPDPLARSSVGFPNQLKRACVSSSEDART
jgi:hypothetical protein